MQVHISPSMRRITISTSNGFLDPLKIKVAARYLSHRCLFWSILFLAFLLPFIFITTALITLEEVNKCSSMYCLGRKIGPKLHWRSDPTRQSRHVHSIVMQASKSDLPAGENVPESFSEFVAEVEANRYDGKTCILKLKAMLELQEQRTRTAKLQEAVYRHFASSGIPKSMHCLALKLTAEYSSNANARRELPSPELTYRLTDHSFHHFVLATDNVLAASVVVSSVIRNSAQPQKVVFHVVTDKKTYAAMHAWFALNPLPPAIVEVKSLHQFEWLTKDNIPVLEAMENHSDIRRYYHGDHTAGADLNVSPTILASRLQARSPKYISILNHLRIYLPELFPELDKVVFLDDDVVAQKDLSPLFGIDLNGRVNGAVETCRGEDPYVMSKRFKTYFNFSHPLIANHFDPEKCAWAYGMNVFDLQAWRRTDITKTYHYWQKQNLNSNLTLWRLGTLPPALIAFDGYVYPIDSQWHMLGLGYHVKSNLDSVQKAAVIHYNGQAKPWLDIGFSVLRPFWTKYVNYSNEFIRRCNILET
ncbi:galacturonosyltransferase GAUT12/13/14/15-like protein [Selaginella moellendorffii]|uniref:Hexosyltransferase n=2 Tax=Selaginella moellendorffii TaxID=88036 RepID=D8SK68_SELML|nr:galacturonosyltransferase GAUT12/13/14/15-like protein [Selaginella moellendorffii]EFJ15176.1 galacturonosyltransferase GAUT12/13/14/15-like protein [Selaginella moellendorffii]